MLTLAIVPHETTSDDKNKSLHRPSTTEHPVKEPSSCRVMLFMCKQYSQCGENMNEFSLPHDEINTLFPFSCNGVSNDPELCFE